MQQSYTIRTLPDFSEWLAALADRPTRLRLARRLDRAARGALGDVKSVGGGVHEMREDFGPGWRMYYALRGRTLIVMLGGGEKSTQRRDIAAAQVLAATIED